VKNIMLTVLGLSPQVLTEGLYALFMEGKTINEIHVITTATGRDRIHAGLLASGQGQFFKFLEDYEIPEKLMSFPPENIHVLKDKNGLDLDDIVSPDDNEILLKRCMELAWQLTSNKEHSVYFMIAGGRKTMSACLALAAQFYGRPCDRIYHVLVSPEFESCREFYFPPREPRLIPTRDPKGTICYRDTKDAEIWLVQLPFVSVRERLMEQDLESPKPPEELLAALIRDNPPKLTIDLSTGKLIFRDREADIPAAQLALLVFFAILRKRCNCKNRPGSSDNESCNNCFISPEEFNNNPEYQEMIKKYYERIKKAGHFGPYLHSETGISKLDSYSFPSYRSKLNTNLVKYFGHHSRDIQIFSIGKKNDKRYGITLESEWIEIIE